MNIFTAGFRPWFSWLTLPVVMAPFVRAADAPTAMQTAATAAADARWPLDAASPRPNATGVCPDTLLRLTFAGTPALGKAGKIHIVDAATGKDVDTIDVGQPVATKTIGGEPRFRYYPAIVDGHEVTIFPRNGTLGYGKSYYVTADAGALTIDGASSGALDPSAGWRFATKAAAPDIRATKLTAAADGSGDFCTIQGAIDFIPDGNTTPRTIEVRKGLYTEIVFFTNKHAITILGEDRKQTVLAYATNNEFNPTNGNPFGSATPQPAAARVGGNIYHRGVFLAHRVDNLVLANLTIRNTTPQGGTQAEAIILNGTTTARAILKDVDLYSYQDTLQINGQAFLSGCYIEGDVDFMWGTGPCFFENCTCRTLRSGAYYTQIRNPGTNHGYVYVGCRFDGAKGIMGNYLSRIGTGRFPDSEVVLIDCTLTPAVWPVAWQFQGGREGNERDPANVHFWEFNSRDPEGKPVDDTFRLKASKRLSEPADATTIANYRNPTYVLGDGWNPKAAAIFAAPPRPPATAPAGAPEIVLQPVSRLALLGTSTTFRLGVAAGTGAVHVQWYKNGHSLPGATDVALRLSHVSWRDAGLYAATVTNASGAATTNAAELTPVAPQMAPAPALPNIPAQTFDVTAFGAVGDGATDNTAAIQKAIDAAHQAGGGSVIVPAAAKAYLCGPLTLASAINLEIAAGATLRCLPYSADAKPGSYPIRGGSYPNFITANGVHDVALTGEGTIDGDGDAWWAVFRKNKGMPHRPFLVRLGKCERVLVAGLTFTRSPMFHVAINADHLTIFGITIATPDETPNTDGVDPSGSHHLIQNCAISCGDDNVVMKPGSAFCSDITVADCAFGEGHGMSVGGQSNRGLDGMVVKNCSFNGTTSALRLKADPTQGGEVKNVSYSNLSMEHVMYPIVFYSYYSKVGNPASTKGSNQTTPEKVHAWNAKPPYTLPSATLPSWKAISVTNVVSSDTKGHSIIWGLPLEGYLIENVKLTNVRLAGSPGFEVYDATNIQFVGDCEVGKLIAANALTIVKQPQSRTVSTGESITLTLDADAAGAPLHYQWVCNGHPLADETRADGTAVAGTTTTTLTLSHVGAAVSGRYAVNVSAALDRYDPEKKDIAAATLPVSTTSATATVTVSAAK